VRILGLDTATRATVAALCELDGGRLVAHVECRDDPPPGSRPSHSARAIELMLAALERSDTAWEEVERIAVGVGPGTFTGLRIGIATARALARARGIPLVGVSSLQSLAAMAAPAAAADGVGRVAGVIDARRGELFAAAWELADAGVPGRAAALEAKPYAPAALAEALGGVLAVGDGAIPSRELLESHGAVVPPDDSELHRVSAIGHCRLGAAIDPGAAGAVSPAYLRLPDAELSRRLR
jgi:tRNA threonylcarbamoyladenosine biosynthesis protein TsaB